MTVKITIMILLTSFQKCLQDSPILRHVKEKVISNLHAASIVPIQMRVQFMIISISLKIITIILLIIAVQKKLS